MRDKGCWTLAGRDIDAVGDDGLPQAPAWTPEQVKAAAARCACQGEGTSAKATVVAVGRVLGVRDLAGLASLKACLRTHHVAGRLVLASWDMFDSADVPCRALSEVTVGAGSTFHFVRVA